MRASAPPKSGAADGAPSCCDHAEDAILRIQPYGYVPNAARTVSPLVCRGTTRSGVRVAPRHLLHRAHHRGRYAAAVADFRRRRLDSLGVGGPSRRAGRTVCAVFRV